MSATQYLNLDFDFIKSSLKDFLRANSNFTDYDFEGSNLSILLDILSYNTFINSYNTNMVANEAFLNTATIRDNIIAHAENIGYIPRSARSARAKVSFNTSYPNGSNASFATLKVNLFKAFKFVDFSVITGDNITSNAAFSFFIIYSIFLQSLWKILS